MVTPPTNTNRRKMEAKMNAIQAAYGDAWEKVRQFCDPDGFIERQVIAHGITNNMEPDKYGFQLSEIRRISHSPDGYYKWRPISLEGVEDNNGWIRCDDRMPESGQMIHRFLYGGYFPPARYSKKHDHGLTHWKPVEEVKPPIY